MSAQAFYMTDRTFGEVLVEVSAWEDRGEYWYVTWRPVYWLDGKSVPNSSNLGAHGTKKFYKDRRHGDTFRRAPVMLKAAPHMGVGVVAGYTMRNRAAA